MKESCGHCGRQLDDDTPDWQGTVNLTPDLLAIGGTFHCFDHQVEVRAGGQDWCNLQCFGWWVAKQLIPVAEVPA